MKNTYQTLFGRKIDLWGLSSWELRLVNRLLKLTQSKPKGLWITLREELYRWASTRHDEIKNGPVGEIFRDCLYRIDFAPKKPDIVKDLRYNPIRLLLDLYLNGYWHSFGAFVRSTGLNHDRVFRAFDQFIYRTDRYNDPSLTSDELALAFERLRIVPTARMLSTAERDEDIAESSIDMSGPLAYREVCFATIIAKAMKMLLAASPDDKEEAVRSVCHLLARNLALTHGCSSGHRVMQNVSVCLRIMLDECDNQSSSSDELLVPRSLDFEDDDSSSKTFRDQFEREEGGYPPVTRFVWKAVDEVVTELDEVDREKVEYAERFSRSKVAQYLIDTLLKGEVNYS